MKSEQLTIFVYMPVCCCFAILEVVFRNHIKNYFRVFERASKQISLDTRQSY